MMLSIFVAESGVCLYEVGAVEESTWWYELSTFAKISKISMRYW